MNRRSLRLLLVLVFSMVWGNYTSAQVTASISGRVEDSSSAAVPGAMVSVVSQETGETRSATTDDSGSFRLLSLPVGRYEIRGEKAGFKTAVQSGIDLVVGQQAVINLTLEVGQVQQEVTVTSEAPLVNTTTSSVSGLVGEETVKDLPLNGRSFDKLITLNAGAANVTALRGTLVGAGGAGAQVANEFSVSGRRWSENLFLLNGIEYPGPSQQHNEPGGVSGQLLGVDAVREFNSISDTYGAEYGKRAGAQVSIVTQSGSNALHGSAFEFLRNSVLDAKNYFDRPPAGERIPPFKRNQFGGALGGPIQKDKTFIFGNYEGFRQRLAVSNVATVPDANMRMGLLPCGTIVPIPATCAGSKDTTPMTVPGLQTGMLAYANDFWPAPNGPELGAGIAEAFTNPPQKVQEDFGTVRVDHSFSSNDQLGLIYTIDNGISQTPINSPNFEQIFNIRAQVLSLQETHIFSPNVINTFMAGFSRAAFTFTSPPLVPIPANLTFLIGQTPGEVKFQAGGISQGGGLLSTDQTSNRTSFTYSDGLQVIRGRHQISAGAWLYQLGSNEIAPVSQGGQAIFATLQSFLQGTVAQFQVTPIQTRMYWRQLEGAWYVQDSIQVKRNLTVRLGLRHEFTNGWNEAHDRAANFDFGPNGVLLTTPVVGQSPFTQNNSKLLFGPRLGLAWDPFGNGKTSVRAGFGTYYDIIDTLGQAFLDKVPPFNGPVTFTNAAFLPLVPFNPATPLPPQCGPGVPTPCTTYSPEGVLTNTKTPTVEEWNLTVERQLTPNMSLSLAYVGSHGYHNEATADPNEPMPVICSNAAGCASGGTAVSATAPAVSVPQGTLYIPAAGVVGSTAKLALPNPYLAGGAMLYDVSTSSYNALNVEFNRRISAGLQFKGAYTWSKDLDIATGLTGADGGLNDVMDAYNPKLDWGPSAENEGQKFVFSGLYELPFGKNKPFLQDLNGPGGKLVNGWQLNFIVTATSGLPFTPLAGSNRSGDGDTSGNSDRPSWNPAFSGPVITGNPNQWFNPNAFILPALGTFGNVGKNSLVGPDFREVDLSIFKTTAITERINLQFRAEGFNVFNRVNFGVPINGVFSGTAFNSTAGFINSTNGTSRQLQFGLKLIF